MTLNSSTEPRLLVSLSSFSGLNRMRVGLLVVRYDDVKIYSPGKRLRFAVVNLDREGGYPLNFVCLLPVRFGSVGKLSAFVRLFGDESLALAKRLLTGALRKEQDSEIKAEIERRLSLLEPPQPEQRKCSGCGKSFLPLRVRKYGQNFCRDCRRKRYGSGV